MLATIKPSLVMLSHLFMRNTHAGNKQQYNPKLYKVGEPDMKNGKSNIKLAVFQFFTIYPHT